LRMKRLQGEIADVLANAEAAIDFAEEDIEPVTAGGFWRH